ncbi:uncharacterized protein LOC118440309 [Vespa mandarinia]|uniref:uncharacterized protein LOC118440309 n=1 Tax=Vespa mandarinia TaxID=7446 RepID=UPI001615CFD2|nr:uncharacterized protein LOC118440309 [Vespa mandarinia]XP_035719055.1 uncharacterized protein LOC118440309 [Vespa mandarinia]XP_046818468.1 uncharacterized protein LOC124424038 [Vespa crabro]XP_046818469.1 uncharacterized protein LOC124424038 [Vespa crabro]
MFLLGVLCALFVTISASTDSCYRHVEEACDLKISNSLLGTSFNCTATFGNIEKLKSELQGYANAHIEYSYEFLLMSTHFGNYESNREGFKALYRKLSDKAWENAINIVKFLTKRGSTLNFVREEQTNSHNKIVSESETREIQFNEIQSLAKALQIEENLTKEAIKIHSDARQKFHDPSVSHFIEEKFMEQQADYMRLLAGHINDLQKLLLLNDPSVALFIFDEYLKKTV